MARKEGQDDVVELVTFNINLNTQDMNGTTHFDLTVHNRKVTYLRKISL